MPIRRLTQNSKLRMISHVCSYYSLKSYSLSTWIIKLVASQGGAASSCVKPSRFTLFQQKILNSFKSHTFGSAISCELFAYCIDFAQMVNNRIIALLFFAIIVQFLLASRRFFPYVRSLVRLHVWRSALGRTPSLCPTYSLDQLVLSRTWLKQLSGRGIASNLLAVE